jgi:hypothetical protein
MNRTGSDVVITYNGTDITNYVLFESCSFEVQFSAVAGSFEIVLKDEARTLGPFVTGKEVTLTIDGTPMFGGYVLQVGRKFAFPVDAIDQGVQGVKTRQWVLRGVDYNILFDKRVLRRSTADTHPGFLKQLPGWYNDDMAGWLIRNWLPKYIDHDGFDLSTDVDDVDYIIPWSHKHKEVAAMQQGTPWRKVMEDFTQFTGAIWYLQPNKRLFHKAIEDSQSKWGFSDIPNRLPISAGGSTWQGSTYGFRELDAVEDGTYLVNDALIWGGSEWAGESGGTVFAREENEESIAAHDRWQIAETHFNEDGYGIQAGVDARAQVLVEGTKSGREDQQYGLRYPQWQFRFAWFGHDVPKISNVRQHLTPGQVVTIVLYTFGSDITHPLIKLMPLRQLRISFPALDPTGDGYVRFDGFFGLQTDDPWTLWKYLLRAQRKAAKVSIAATSNASETAVYGSIGSFQPAEAPDGSRTSFSIYITVNDTATALGYLSGTTSVYLNGLLQRPQIDYTESDPENGAITFIRPPSAGAWILIKCRTMAA